MRRYAIMMTAILIVVALVGTAFAIPAGKQKVYKNNFGEITFSSDAHKAKGIGCMDCHKDIFKMAAGATQQPVPHKVGESCGTCHNGDRAFSVTTSCKSCHVK